MRRAGAIGASCRPLPHPMSPASYKAGSTSPGSHQHSLCWIQAKYRRLLLPICCRASANNLKCSAHAVHNRPGTGCPTHYTGRTNTGRNWNRFWSPIPKLTLTAGSTDSLEGRVWRCPRALKPVQLGSPILLGSSPFKDDRSRYVEWLADTHSLFIAPYDFCAVDGEPRRCAPMRS